MSSNKEAREDEEDQSKKSVFKSSQSSNDALKTRVRKSRNKLFRQMDEEKNIQVKEIEEGNYNNNMHEINTTALMIKQNQERKKSKKVKLTTKKKIRTKYLSDNENHNYIMHNFHPESPLQEEELESNGKIDDINESPTPDFCVEQNIMATIATSLIELNSMQTTATTTPPPPTTTTTATTTDVLTEGQLLDVVQNIEDNFDDEDEEELEEQSDNDEKVTSHHHNHHHHLNHQRRLRQTSIGLEQRKPDKITDAQLDRLSSLIKIIRNGNYNEFLEALEGKGGFKNLLNIFVDGQTALHYTLIYGRSIAWCKQLVLNGANPNLTNRAGWHPIHLAAFNGSRETMRYLIDCIAN